MEYNKEHLNKLLAFISDIYNDPDNIEFAEGIRNLVGVSGKSNEDKKFEKIEKYLGLDYGLDTISNPNYSFIKDDKVRNMLDSDYREMLRYIYGTRGHSIDFVEFTRYVNLQIELLVNYYYNHKYNGDISRITGVIQKYNPYTIEIPNSLGALSLNSKINGLKGEFGWEYPDIIVYLNILKVRNDASHRSPESISEAIRNKEIEISCLESKARKTTADHDRIVRIKKDLYNCKEYQKWLTPYPFGEVFGALESLVKRIKQEILK